MLGKPHGKGERKKLAITATYPPLNAVKTPRDLRTRKEAAKMSI